MKTELTTEQSRHLIELGVPKEKASKVYWKEVTDFRGRPFDFDYDFREGITDKPFALQRVGLTSFNTQDIFTLTDLLEILPKEIEYEECLSEFTMQWNSTYQCWDVGYVYSGGFWKGCRFRHAELIDALYELACWYYEVYSKSRKK